MSHRRSKGLHELADEIAKLIDDPEPVSDDSTLAHVTPGEMVIPAAFLTPELIALLSAEARRHGVDPARFFVGSGRNSINPFTGQPEFFDPTEEEIEGITVTTPHEKGLVQLPQNFPNSGFYNYGTPVNGAGQYGAPAVMEVIGAAGKQWQQGGNAPMGVGNISLEHGGPFPPHSETGDHARGTGFDMRPIRKDRRPVGVDITSPEYDRDATQHEIETVRVTEGVEKVFFNDTSIPGVERLDKHDNHIHFAIKPKYRRPPGR